jgi:hypothetical protein
MAQHDYVIDNQTAPNFRADLNNALLAIVSNNSGSSAPSTTYANMIWYDSGANILKMRNEADDVWINLGTLDQVANTFAANILLASQAEAEAGSNNTKAMTPLRTAQAITALAPEGVGEGQTWQAVTRATNTSYQNTTGKPIMLVVTGTNNTSNSVQNRIEISTDNSTWVTASQTYGRNWGGPVTAIIPNNHYYRQTGVGQTGDVVDGAGWVYFRELR